MRYYIYSEDNKLNITTSANSNKVLAEFDANLSNKTGLFYIEKYCISVLNGTPTLEDVDAYASLRLLASIRINNVFALTNGTYMKQLTFKSLMKFNKTRNFLKNMNSK